MNESDDRMQKEARLLWDEAAPTFDDEPDHGLRDPMVAQAWTEHLTKWLPPAPASVLDIDCGTGSLSVVLTLLGYTVTGIDFAPAMIERAEQKAHVAKQQISFHVMDAAAPALSPQQYDVVLCRHVLWALPKTRAVLHHWANLLTPTGRFVLIEGYWFTEAGLHAAQVVEAMPPYFNAVTVENLSGDQRLWGRAVTDERYAILASRSEPPQ